MDLLYDHAEEIEKHVFFQTANLFNLKVDLIFYDTTTASFSIDQEDESTDESDEAAIRKYGIFDNFDGYYWETRNNGEDLDANQRFI